jgi:hypothetical protein
VDAAAPKLGLENVKQGHASTDERLNRAVTEVIEKCFSPRPDCFFLGAVSVATETSSVAASRGAQAANTRRVW